MTGIHEQVRGGETARPRADEEARAGAGERGRRGVAALALLAALLAGFAAMKLAYDPPPAGHARTDATTYYLVARSVAHGEGLRTSVSLYHQGLRDLPALSPIYPLWPLVLGAAGRLVGLERAAALLPEALYLVDLLLIYLVGKRLAGELGLRPLLGRRLPFVDLGHLGVLLLGTNPLFFKYSSLCMTEPLALGLLLAALLVLQAGADRPRHAAIAGVLGGLAYLTRSQFVLVPVALPLAFWLAGRGRPRRARVAAWAAAGALVAVLPWVLFLLSLPGSFHPRVLVDFTAYRETPALPRFTGFVEHDTLAARFADAAAGLGDAFDPRHAWSYARSLGYAVYLVPLALGVWLVAARREAQRSAGATPALALGTALTALASLLPVHLMHGNYPAERFFGARHGLPMILGILPAAGYLLGRRLPLRLVALGLVASTPFLRNPFELMRQDEAKRAAIWPAEVDLVAWLDAHERPPVAVSTQCRELALWSRASFHWIVCDSAPDETRSLFENLPIDYLIVYSSEEDCAFLRGLEAELELVRTFPQRGRSIDVYRWRRG
jgi:hypothetical protein